MSKILAVFGATGQQGGSLIDVVLNDPEISHIYNVRAVTRNSASKAAQILGQKGAEVVQADITDQESIRSAVRGADTVFLVTVTDYDAPPETEFEFGRIVTDAAVAEKVRRIIFSTLCSPSKVSKGKYVKVDGFDVKGDIEDYIRRQPIKSSFFSPGTFMQNFLTNMRPQPTGDGDYTIFGVATTLTQWPLIEIAADTGKYVAAILADPAAYDDKVLSAATKLLTMEDITQIYSQVTGKNVTYKQLPVEVFGNFFPNKRMASNVIEMALYFQDFGYFGPNTSEKVADTAARARGRLTTFEEYLQRHKPDLDEASTTH